jgi:hypothetical protein
MPLINPVFSAQLRRHWQVVVSIVVFVLFVVVHLVVFRPNSQRLVAALKRAGDLGLALDPDRSPPVMPPRVLALLTDNALPASSTGGESGTLTADLLEELTQLTTRRGMQVLVTDPGTTAIEAKAVQVRAHLRIRCSPSQFIAFLDDLGRSNRVISVDRFALVAGESGRDILDLWVTRYILKQTSGKRPS